MRGELRRLNGLPVTSPERTIVDSLEAGTQLEQVDLAVRQTLDRALTAAPRLREAASERSAPVRRFIDQVLNEAEP